MLQMGQRDIRLKYLVTEAGDNGKPSQKEGLDVMITVV